MAPSTRGTEDRLERLEQERAATLHFFASMDRINLAMEGATDLDQLLQQVLDAVLEVFACDRAWVLHPSDQAWTLRLERTRPDPPGALAHGVDPPGLPETVSIARLALDSGEPVRIGQGAEGPEAARTAQEFGVDSSLVMALRLAGRDPWIFGLHQYSHPRAWTPQEVRLFRDIGRRLADGLNHLLIHRDLGESEGLYRLITESSTDLICLMDFQGKVMFISPSVAQVMGFEADQVLGSNIFGFLHPEDAPASLAALTRAATGETVTFHHRAMHADGTWHLLDGWGRAVQYKGTPLALAVSRDITSQKQSDEAMTLLRSLIDHTKDSIEVIDFETGRFLDVNEMACLACGYSREEYLSRTVAEIDPLVSARSWEATREDIRHAGALVFESQHRRKDGSVFPVEVNVNYVHLDREYLFAVARDISERKRLEEQLAQAQKMELVGRLAGGIAHDFNNMLGVILGRTDLALAGLEEGQPLHAALQEIRKAAEHSADLTRQLLTFARKQQVDPRVIDLNETVAGALRILHRLIGESIELVWSPGAGICNVRIDPSQIEQILTNLCANARDATGGAGRIIIETQAAAFDEAHCATHAGYVPGAYALLSVSDTGSGIDQEHLGRIFEPFFTTKEFGQGTGLGLATVYGIVRQNNGFIEVESGVARGTTFRVFLPRHEAGLGPVLTASEAQPIPHGDESILLVEDEPSVLALTTHMLEGLGYRVVTFAQPEEALRIARDRIRGIQLLVTDVIMPGMNGWSLAKALLQLHPELKCLFMSGYTAEAIAWQGLEHEGVHFIQKPFSMQTFAVKVREALEGPPLRIGPVA